MAITYWAGNIIRCLSSDTKPSAATYDDFMLIETDTGSIFTANAGVWTTKSFEAGTTSHADLGTVTATQHHSNANDHARQHSVTAVADHTFPGGGTTYLRDDGTFATPPGGSNAFPVGSVFMAVVSTNPATLLGYGTWSAIGAGRVLVGLDSGDTDFDVAEETGGAKTSTPDAHAGTAVGTSGAGSSHSHSHTHTAGTLAGPSHSHSHQHDSLGGHTHDNHGFTQPTAHGDHSVTAVITHQHKLSFARGATTGGATTTQGFTSSSDTSSTAITESVDAPTGAVASQALAHTNNHAGGATTPTTHASGGTHQHAADATLGGTGAVTASTASDATAEAAHTHTAGAVTQPNAHAAMSVVQPYFVVYMWKRTV